LSRLRRRAALLAAGAAAAFGALCGPAQAGWRSPQVLAPPQSLDVLAPALALSPTGAAAIAYGVQDEDAPTTAAAFLVRREARGVRSRPLRVPGAQQVLDAAFNGSRLELLSAGSESGQPCCSRAAVQAVSGRRFGRPQTLVRVLAGPTLGRLVSWGGQSTAVVASSRGVWVAQANRRGRFARTRRVSDRSDVPEALAAAPRAGGGVLIAWSAASDTTSTPRSIFTASGSARSAPAHRRTAITVPRDHEIDDIALAPGAAAPTLAWIESWVDRRGSVHSEVEWQDLTRRARPSGFATAGTVAAGLQLAGDGAGDQVLSWRTCNASGACAARLATRRHGQPFGRQVRVAAMDGSDVPAAAISRRGQVLVGWVASGHVYAAAGRPGGRLGAPRLVSATNYAADLTLAFSPAGFAMAVWSQGTLAPDVVGALYRP
jgi:hypothetical protein